MSDIPTPDTAEDTPEKTTPDAAMNATDAAEVTTPKVGLIRWKAVVLVPIPFVIFTIIYALFGNSIARSAFDAALKASLGEQTKVSDYEIDFSIFGPTLTVENLECFHPDKALAKDKTTEELGELPEDAWLPVVSLTRFNTDVEFFSLLDGRVWINDFEFTGLRVHPNNFSDVKEPEDEEEPEATPQTPIQSVTQTLEQINEMRKNEWIKRIHQMIQDARSGKSAEKKKKQAKDKRPASPQYILDHLEEVGGPTFLLKKGKIGDMELDFHRKKVKKSGAERSFHSLTQTTLELENISSAPKALGGFLSVEGFGLVNGKDNEKINLDVSLNFSNKPEHALDPSLVRIYSDSLKFLKLFDEPLSKVDAGFYAYPETHPSAQGNAVVRVKGELAKLGAQAELSLWLPLSSSDNDTTALGLRVNDVPIDRVAKQLGSLPFDFEPGMKANLLSCSAEGKGIDQAPDDPSTCFRISDSKLEMHLLLRLTNARLKATPGKKVLGIPSERFAPAFNDFAREVESTQGGIDLQIGFTGSPQSTSFGLERPGTRGLVLAVISSMKLGIKDVAGNTDIGGIVFDDNLTIDLVGPMSPAEAFQSQDDELTNITVRAILRNAQLDPKKQPRKIAGMESKYFVFAWNKFIGDKGATPIADVGLFDGKGNYSPSLSLDLNSIVGDMGDSLGLENLLGNPEQALSEVFGKEFDDYSKNPEKIIGELVPGDTNDPDKVIGELIPGEGKDPEKVIEELIPGRGNKPIKPAPEEKPKKPKDEIEDAIKDFNPFK